MPTSASVGASAATAPSAGPVSHTRSVALPIGVIHSSILERGPLFAAASASASAASSATRHDAIPSASSHDSCSSLPSPALHHQHQQHDNQYQTSSTTALAVGADFTANADSHNAAAREHSLRQWLASLIADDAAARHAPLLSETVDARTGTRQLEVNSATLAAVELSLEHALAQRVGAFADRARAAFERRVRAIAADAADALRDAETRHAQRVALVEREAGALV